jgi:acetyl esterase/lipase
MRVRPRRVRLSVVGATTAVAVTSFLASVLFLAPASAGAHDAAVDSSAALPLTAIGPGKTTLTYCDENGVAETLDIYEPNPVPSTPVPAVVYVHGGGWVGGSSAFASGSLVGQVARSIEAKGWIFVSIDYSLAPRFRWPAPIEDAKCAIRFLRAASSTLEIDPGAIGAMGDSAGGQIVSLLGLARPSAGFDVGQDLNQSSGVQAVVDLYGPADLTTPDWIQTVLIQSDASKVFGTALGPAAPGTPAADTLEKASPVTYVGPDEPPFLIIQGDDDSVVPADQSTELADRLQAAGNAATLILVSHAQHGLLSADGATVTPPVPTLARRTVSFLERSLQS